MNNHRSMKRQRGVLLLEGLLAILIFSLGVLGMIGLQATAIKQSSAAKYRTDASLMANQLIGQMWASNRDPTVLKANFESPAGAGYTSWKNDVANALPGVTSTSNLPTVAITNNVATITLFWKMPNEPAADPPHSYVVMAQFN